MTQERGTAHSRVVGFSDSRDSRVVRVSIEWRCGSFPRYDVKLLACHGYALSKMRKIGVNIDVDALVRRGERFLVRSADRDTIC